MSQRGTCGSAGGGTTGVARAANRRRGSWVAAAMAAVTLAGLLPVTAADAGGVVVWPGRGVAVRPWVRPWGGPWVRPWGRPWIGPVWGAAVAWPYLAGPPGVAVVDGGPVEYIERGDGALDNGGPADLLYYCRKPKGYYPDVQRCPGGWEKVPPGSAR
jgi:hypothetical protein